MMAVKVCVNGQMKKIDTTLHKPVIFLNGQKKVLAKAWVFINGQKQMLWGQEGVNIDYIKANGLVTGYSDIIAIGEDWMITSGANAYYDKVIRWDISNLTSPTIIQDAAWGTINYNGFNGYKSVGESGMYFTARTGAGATTSGNELFVNPMTGVVTINNSFSTTANDSAIVRGMIDNTFISAIVVSRHTALGNLTYGSKYYFGTTLSRTTGTEADPFYMIMNNGIVQATSGVGLIKTNKGTYALSSSSLTQKSTTIGDILLYDGDYIIAKRTNGFGVYNKSTLAEIRYHDAAAGDSSLFIGKNGNYYYTVEYNSSSAKFLVLRASDLSLRWQTDLPIDPFGDGSLWANAFVRPQVTQTGYLAVSARVSANTRVIRFSQMYD